MVEELPVEFAAGHWAACRECSRLHETQSIEGLLDRVTREVASYREIPEYFQPRLREILRMVFGRISRTRENLQTSEEYLRTHAN